MQVNASPAATPPSFAQFPVAEHFSAVSMRPKLTSRQDREFKSALVAAARRPVNFAGHFILTTIGCGASCLLIAVIDAKTGHISWSPFTLCCWPVERTEPVGFRRDSDLIVQFGQINETGHGGAHFFRFVHGQFIALHDGSSAQ